MNSEEKVVVTSSGISETKWTDDRIRWPEDDEKNKRQDNDDDDEEEEEEECPIDIFKDQNPHETFEFHYNLIKVEEEVVGVVDKKECIDIVLNGYKSDSDEIWKSTGLTIWRAADFLCQYLIEHRNDENLNLTCNDGKRILELGAGLGEFGFESK